MVELMVGIMAAAMLALGMGVMLVNMTRGWRQANNVADLERDMALAVHTLNISVRSASSTNAIQPVVGVNVLEVPVFDKIQAFSVSGGSLFYNRDKNGGGQGMLLVSNRLASSGGFWSAYDSAGRVITVSLKLLDSDSGVALAVTNSIRLRN